MPLQEAIIFGPTANLVNPAGVGFGAPVRTAKKDQEMWTKETPNFRLALKEGDAIGLLVQTRNGREFDKGKRNPSFNYEEDYIVAAFRLAANLGVPWKPGLMIMHWVNLFSYGRKGMEKYRATAGIDQFFQCTPAGCKLSRNGPMIMVEQHEKNGSSRGEAMQIQMGTMLMPNRKVSKGGGKLSAGWIGGYFDSATPAIVKGPTIGNRRSFDNEMQAPNYQAPLPPGN